MKLVSKNFLICSHKMVAVSKLNRRPKPLMVVRVDRALPRQRPPSTLGLSMAPAKSPMRQSASNNHLLENYLKLQRKRPQILPNTENWLGYEEIQNLANVMRDFPHSYKRNVTTGLLENNWGYKSKAPIFADNSILFWSSKIEQTYDRIKDFPVSMFWAPMQNSVALDIVGGPRIPGMVKDGGFRWFSKGPQSGLERTRRPGGKVGRLNQASTEYLALYNKLQKARLEELKRKFTEMKIELDRKEAAAATMKNEGFVGAVMKKCESLISPTIDSKEDSKDAPRKAKERDELGMPTPGSLTMLETPKKDALEGQQKK